MTTYNIVSPGAMVAGQPEDISVILSNFQAIAAVLNGGIDNGNINAAAAIAASKLAGYPTDGTKSLRGDGSWGSLGLTTNPVTISAANTDLTLAAPGAISNILRVGTGGGSLRSISAPVSNGFIIFLQNASGSTITLKHSTAGGSGAPLYSNTAADVILGINATAILTYLGGFWTIEQANATGLASATSGLTVSGTNTDLAWTGGGASVVYAQVGTGGGSLRSLGTPIFGAGTRYILRNSSGGNVTILHATGGGSGQQFYMRSLGSLVLAPNENAEFIFDGSLWVEVGRNQAPTAAAITYAAVRMSAAQNHNSGGSYSVMAFDAEDLDTSNFHDNVTNNTRLTVPTTGIYRLFGTAQFTGQVNLMGIKFRKNGATDLYGVETVGGAGKQGISHTDMVSLNAGDYVEALALQSNGVQAYAVGSSGAVCRFGIHLVT